MALEFWSNSDRNRTRLHLLKVALARGVDTSISNQMRALVGSIWSPSYQRQRKVARQQNSLSKIFRDMGPKRHKNSVTKILKSNVVKYWKYSRRVQVRVIVSPLTCQEVWTLRLKSWLKFRKMDGRASSEQPHLICPASRLSSYTRTRLASKASVFRQTILMIRQAFLLPWTRESCC